ncbi:MAG TPA: hypothetical protein VE956_04050 [Nodularia sp. (in: cyanobacteria)]|nr:hypothetical protein [Nodularia sp. (in: cyanobacteria)]
MSYRDILVVLTGTYKQSPPEHTGSADILKPARVEKPLPTYMADVEDPITPEQLSELQQQIKRIVH